MLEKKTNENEKAQLAKEAKKAAETDMELKSEAEAKAKAETEVAEKSKLDAAVAKANPELTKQLAESNEKLQEAEKKLSVVGTTSVGKQKLMDYEVHNSWDGVNYKKPYWKIRGRFRNDAGDLIRLVGKVQVPVGKPGTVPVIIVFKNGVGVTNNHAAARKMFKAMVTPSIIAFNPKNKKAPRGITVLSE